MKIGLDLHGVVNDMPDAFKFITESIIKNGGEVHILTGSTTKKAYVELSLLGFEYGKHYTHIMGLPNYLSNKGCKVIGFNKEFQNNEFSTEDWNKAKAIYCSENKINLHLDDTIEYGGSILLLLLLDCGLKIKAKH